MTNAEGPGPSGPDPSSVDYADVGAVSPTRAIDRSLSSCKRCTEYATAVERYRSRRDLLCYWLSKSAFLNLTG